MSTKNNYMYCPFITLLFMFFPFIHANAQQVTFMKVYSSSVNQSTRDVRPTPDGGYMIAGMTGNNIPGDSDLYIVKTNSTGDIEWTKTYGGPHSDYPHTLLPLSDGNYFIVGYTASFGAGGNDIWLLKIDPSGDTLWTKTFGGTGDDEGKEIIATGDGNYMIAGMSNSNIVNYDAVLMKINGSGDVIWTKYYGGTEYETAASVKQCADGGYVFVGQTMSYDVGNGDIYLVKLNAAGDLIWTKTFGGARFDEGKYVLANSDGSITLCGNDSSSGAGDLDVQVIKTDMNGNVIWNKTYGGNKKEVCKMIQPTSDGGYIVSAVSRSFGWINPNMWLIKLDAVGDTMWTRSYGSWDHEHCYAVRQTADGGFIAVGHTKSFSANTEILMVKTNSAGYLGVLAVDELALQNAFKIYPNPTEGLVNIEFSEKNVKENSVLHITNMLGQEVYTENILRAESMKNKSVDLKNLESGVYTLNLQSENSSVTKRLVLK